MKKNLLYMLTAAAMLAGCAKNDVVVQKSTRRVT